MGFFKCYAKRTKYLFLRTTLLVLMVVLLGTNVDFKVKKEGANFFYVYVNDSYCGVLDSQEAAEKCFIEARRTVATEHEDLTLLNVDFKIVPEEKVSGVYDSAEEVQANLTGILKRNTKSSIRKSYTVKVNNTSVNLSGIEDVKAVLRGAVDKYVTPDKARYEIVVDRDLARKFNVLCAQASIIKEAPGEEETETEITNLSGGVQSFITGFSEETDEPELLDFEDYELGMMSIMIVQNVDVTECYLLEDKIDTVENAITILAEEQDVETEYVVQKGDTLSGIASALDIPIDEIISMNSSILKNVNSTLHIGDILTIYEPVPELTVRTVERNYYEQDYQAPVQYVNNDSWYTTQTKVLQEPSTGFRKVIFDETYENGVLVSQDVVKEELVVEAVPKIIERGTKIPPTYIKPINGGRLSSGYGYRGVVAGSGAMHKGVDWAVPTGTAVYASNGGKVTKAGWGTGYGYCVYIQHDDGRVTRYAHCSKVLVSAGTYVKQGDKIALSGNTGQSTGPHLHFEILINGRQVDPLKYLS